MVMTDEKRAILEKVKKCLALAAEGSGATEDEAVSAAEKAREILDKWNLSIADVAKIEIQIMKYAVSDGRWENEKRDDEVRRGAVWPAWKERLFSAIAAGMGLGHFRQYWRHSMHQKLFLVGPEADIQVAEYLFIYLVRQVKTLTTKYAMKYRDGCGYAASELVKNSYRLGVVSSLHKRLGEINRKSEAVMSAVSVTGKELVIVRKDAIQKFMDEMNLKHSSGGHQRLTQDYYSGVEAGRNIPIHTGINGAKGTKYISA